MRSCKENILEIRVRRKIFCDSVLEGKYFLNQSEKENIFEIRERKYFGFRAGRKIFLKSE
jgi:hypothetical protein